MVMLAGVFRTNYFAGKIPVPGKQQLPHKTKLTAPLPPDYPMLVIFFQVCLQAAIDAPTAMK